jgi:hypothetical protein
MNTRIEMQCIRSYIDTRAFAHNVKSAKCYVPWGVFGNVNGFSTQIRKLDGNMKTFTFYWVEAQYISIKSIFHTTNWIDIHIFDIVDSLQKDLNDRYL